MKRLLFVLIIGFWGTMMVLLWRAEFAGKRHGGSHVPISSVWEKILTAPDHSSLQITQHGTNLGFCRWSSTVGADISEALQAAEEPGLEGMIEAPVSYNLDLDGHVNLPSFGTRAGYNVNLKLDGDRNWQEFLLRLKMRPDVYEIHATAAAQAVDVQSDTSEGRFRRTIKFSEFRNPQKLLSEVGGPMLPALLGSMGLPLSTNMMSRLSSGLDWQARQDWLQAGRSRMRVYLLEARLLDLYRVRVYVSPVGEILRVELPGDILLLHDSLNNLPPVP